MRRPARSPASVGGSQLTRARCLRAPCTKSQGTVGLGGRGVATRAEGSNCWGRQHQPQNGLLSTGWPQAGTLQELTALLCRCCVLLAHLRCQGSGVSSECQPQTLPLWGKGQASGVIRRGPDTVGGMGCGPGYPRGSSEGGPFSQSRTMCPHGAGRGDQASCMSSLPHMILGGLGPMACLSLVPRPIAPK